MGGGEDKSRSQAELGKGWHANRAVGSPKSGIK